ncbi:ATP-binding protein [Hydrogenophaga pseudoflava]|uniref:ATP-binding protein n=1 Tax=Hydrogenophaga pseudoflava TaxID=47421 RepID=UPI0027E565AE|nr:ATP-binding protein [Hydrogenophaga pseudoflava]MDQ7745290.1 ATP-binding protein [Hydrogenophaga pseudoflava]
MKALSRSFALLVALFTVVAAGVLWWQALRAQNQLREQVLLQAEQRSLHVADAMAGQVRAHLSTMDVTLRTLRDHWAREPRERFDVLTKDALASLPPGLVSHVSVADASGHLVYNSLGLETGRYVGDRDSFRVASQGPDAMRVSATVRSRLTGRWVFAVDRPMLRQGRFDGVIYMVVESVYLARELGKLELSDQDVVSLVHPDGHYLARSEGNEASMGKQVPADRPYRALPTLLHGTYRVGDVVDHAPRTYGWHRLPDSGLVVSVGLADDSVLAPLAPALRRNLLVTGVLSLLLLGFGGVIVRDQLRMTRDQRALARSEAGLKEAQQLAGLGSWECDLATGRLHWSDEVYRIFEVDPAIVQPSFERFLEWVHPDDRRMVQQAFDASIRDRRTYNVVHRLLLPGGRIKYVRERGVTEYEGDRPVRSMGTVLDITEVREAQLALQQLNEELESRVSRRTGELAQANRELEAFAYSVSHDLRTPLRSIHGFACVLEEEESDRLSDAGRRHLRRIQDGSRRMGQLITDLLSLAHLGRAKMNLARVDLSELALQLAADLHRAEPGREVDWDIEEGLHAMADPGLMRVVLQNLLGNAWKYTGQTPQPRISLSRTHSADGLVTFCVRDNGAGFDMAYAAQLFQPFRRLHAHHEFEGSGVGLATVSRVVRRHGGQVRGEGVVGQGAAFYFSLPKAPALAPVTAW